MNPNEDEIRALLQSAPPHAATNLMMDRLLWELQDFARGPYLPGTTARTQAEVQTWVDRHLIALFNKGLFWTDKLRLIVTMNGTQANLAWSLEPLPDEA